jgi:hypothetical protein
MSYIGQGLPADTFQGFTTDSFTGDGSATTFTLSKEPFSEDTLIVVINNVIQKPTTNFTVSGTTLTIVGTAVADGDVIYAIHMGGPLPIGEANKLDINGASDQLILDLDGDTTISADTDDQIDFKVAGTDVVKITAATLDVTGPGNTGGIININNTDTEGANTDNIGRINFVGNDGSSSASGTRAAIETEVTGNFGSTQLNIEVAAGGAAAAKIATFSPTGLNLADGDITLASGHGINFAATADATGQASELLDDYEEGTWSIIVEDHNDNAMTLNGSYNTGTYVKVGGQVTITGYFLVTSLGSASGAVRIDGLPYTILGNARNYTGMLVGYAAGLNVTAGTTVAGVSIINTNHVNLTNFDTAAGTTNLDASKVTADGQMIFSMTYMTI